MPISAKSIRIGGASLIAVLMVAGGYVLPELNAPKTKTVNAELTDDILANYVSKDTDADGLPDWQEVLYGTNVNVADSDNDGISDGEAVRRGLLTPTTLSAQIPENPIGEEDIPGEEPAPGSLTEQFSRALFEAFVKTSGGQPMTAETQQALVNQLLADFSARAGKLTSSTYTRVSVRTNPALSITEYAAAVESILRRNDVDLEGRSPSEWMQAFIENGDEAAHKKLTLLGNAEAGAARELLALSVPPALVEQHLLLLRSTDSLSKATLLITKHETDPIGTMGALTVYAPISRDFTSAVKEIATVIVAGGEPLAGAPGAYLVQIARSVEGI